MRIILPLALTLCLMACSMDSSQNPQIAVVQGQSITLHDFHAQSAFMGLGPDPIALTPDMRFQIVDLLIERELLLDQARRIKVELEPYELDGYEAGVRQGLEDDIFERKLIEQGITYEQWRDILRSQLLSRKILDMLLTHRIARITPEQINAYFSTHQEDFSRPEQALAQHALFSSRQTAQKVADLVRKGKDLSQAASEAGAPLDGDTEPAWLSRGLVPAPLEKTIFALQPGKVAGPIASDYGFHVILLLAKREALEPSLAGAAEEIQRILIRQAKEETALIMLKELREKSKIWMDNRFLSTGQTE